MEKRLAQGKSVGFVMLTAKLSWLVALTLQHPRMPVQFWPFWLVLALATASSKVTLISLA